MTKKLKNAVIFVYGSAYTSFIWYIANGTHIGGDILFLLAMIMVIAISIIGICRIVIFLIGLFYSNEE